MERQHSRPLTAAEVAEFLCSIAPGGAARIRGGALELRQAGEDAWRRVAPVADELAAVRAIRSHFGQG